MDSLPLVIPTKVGIHKDLKILGSCLHMPVQARQTGGNDNLDYLWRNSKVSWLKQGVDKRSQGRSLHKKHDQAQNEEEDQHGDEQIVAAPGKENQNPQGLE